MNIFEHVFILADGRPMPLDRYRNQPILLVNFQPGSERLSQLWKLQRMYADLRDAGLLVIGLPSPTRQADDDSIQQEFSEDELDELINEKYALRYPVTRPLHLYGPDAHPLFQELREKHGRQVLPLDSPHKYLFNRKGELVEHWPGRIEPDHPKFVHEVQSHLQAWVV